MAKTKRRKKRTHVPASADPSKKGDPKSFVFRRGRHGAVLRSLEADLRKVMLPNTAPKLKESRRNLLKDFVNVAGPLGVTHFLILTATENAAYLRIAKSPRGPTVTLRVHEYALIRDVLGAQQRPRAPSSMWKGPPLVVLNNFKSAAGGPEVKLSMSLFEGLFPSINIRTAKLSACQRMVLLSRDPQSGRISFRHYNIAATPSGVTKSIKSLVGQRHLPNMAHLTDISELLTKSGYGSESEGEEAAEARVTLPQDLGRGNLASRQSRIRLHEVGPRMELEIVKVEEGLCTGQVLFHAHQSRTPQEVAVQAAAFKDRETLRAQRRRQQEENVKRKEVAKKRKAEGEGGQKGLPNKRGRAERGPPGEAEDDDDVEVYRQEVGEEPDDVVGLKRPRKAVRGRSPGGAEGRKGGSREGEDRKRGSEGSGRGGTMSHGGTKVFGGAKGPGRAPRHVPGTSGARGRGCGRPIEPGRGGGRGHPSRARDGRAARDGTAGPSRGAKHASRHKEKRRRPS